MQRLSQDPTDPAFVQDPYPFYETARRTGRVFFWSDYALPCLTGFADVDAALRDRRLGREVPEDRRPPVPAHLADFMAFERHSLLEIEPPRHTRLRGLVMRAFTARRIAALEPFLRGLARELIAAFPATPFNLLAAYAQKIPVLAIARLLGVPAEDSDRFLSWSHDMVAIYQAGRDRAIEERANAATRAFTAYMRAYVDSRRGRPGDDLLSALIQAEEDGGRLDTDELITTAILLLNAGHEATVHGIGNAVRLLILHREKTGADLPALVAPGAIAATVEECLRFDPPLHMFTRHVYEKVAIAGHDFAPGDQLGLLLAAANRDPEVWEAPDRFDPTRRPRPLASFGAGVHFCIGAPLARLEMQIALQELFTRLPRLALAETPRFADRYHFRGLERLMVRTG